MSHKLPKNEECFFFTVFKTIKQMVRQSMVGITKLDRKDDQTKPSPRHNLVSFSKYNVVNNNPLNDLYDR